LLAISMCDSIMRRWPKFVVGLVHYILLLFMSLYCSCYTFVIKHC